MWQAYQTLYYKEKLKPLVDAAYQTHLKSVPEDTKPKSRFSIMNEIVQKAWAEETEEVKAIVEEYRQKSRDEQPGDTQGQDTEARNKNYQK